MTPQCPSDQNKRDADFAAFARTALSQLLTITKELEAERDETEKSRQQYLGWYYEEENKRRQLESENATLKRRLDEAMKTLQWFAKSPALGFTANKTAFDTITRITEIDKL